MSQKQANIGLSLDQSGTLFAPKKQSMDSLGSIIKSPRAPTPRTPITTREAIDTLKLKLTQANDLQHLFEKYLQQVNNHSCTIQINIDKQFDEMVKQLMKRKDIIKQQVNKWKNNKLTQVSNEIESAGQYEDILLAAQKRTNEIIKTNKLQQKQKQQQIKQIKSEISNTNDEKFKIYNNSKELSKYINNITSLINVEYKDNMLNELSNYGKMKINSNNSFLSVPVLNLLKPITGRKSKNGYKIKLKWKTSQPLIANNFIVRCLNKNENNNNDDEKKQNDYKINKRWKSLIFKIKTINKDNTEFEAFDIETVFSFDEIYTFRLEYHITDPVNLLIGSNEEIHTIENKPPSDVKPELIELEYVSSYGNSYEGHAKNLLSDDKAKKYRSKHNKDFGYDENDWVIFKLKHTGHIRTYLPKAVLIKNTSGTQALKELIVSIGDKIDGNKWYKYNMIEIDQNKDKYQECLLNGVDWKIVKQMKTQFIKLELMENYGESRGAQCRFKVQEFKLYGVEFKCC